MAAVGDMEAVLVLEIFAVLLEHPGVLFIADIADPLEKQQRLNVGCFPEAEVGGQQSTAA